MSRLAYRVDRHVASPAPVARRSSGGRSMLALGLATLLLLGAACAPSAADRTELRRWQQRAEGITIVRDDWGIAHVYGATDADAVFGMIYAQAEDDFHRIEVNYLNAMGRLSEAVGPAEVFRDLRMKLFIDPAQLQRQYEEAPEWLRALMDAWADGLNWYLHTHPDVKPLVLARFEPWMALSFTEGSIGGDMERVSIAGLRDLYGDESDRQAAARAQRLPAATGAARPLLSEPAALLTAAGFAPTTWPDTPDPLAEPSGSNGIAISPANPVDGHALLLINPHTSFYFRSELHMVSDEGLNAYGAVTWGQFFVYQGFNETAGWMHTSTGADAIDEYAYDVDVREDGVYYRYGDGERRMREKQIVVPYRDGDRLSERTFTVYYSHHGPIVRAEGDRWFAVKLMNQPVKALTQSYTRTKAANYEQFRQTMRLHTNSSNNTVFADAEGNIAYFHANYIPIRDTRFDWSKPVDGSDPATEWQGITSLEDSPDVVNPATGWIQNTNNWPYSVAGEASPRREDYPPYMDRVGENPRGIHAMRLLRGRTDFTLDGLVEAAFDSYLTAFEPLIPALLDAYDRLPADEPLRAQLAGPVAALRSWDLRWSVDSVPTALAVFWGREMLERYRQARPAGMSIYEYLERGAGDRERLDALAAAVARLQQDFGGWQTPWGEINRFQRIVNSIEPQHDDDAPSIPVGFTSGRWGSLASFAARRFGTKHLYGYAGNSFVAAVQFGDRLRARAVTAGGESGDPNSPHFNDQAERYATGDLRPVYFYREEVDAHAERTYHPGE